jgi:hypothetical protein
MKEVAIVAGDPGGANLLLPVIKTVREKGYFIRLYAYAQALNLWQKQGESVLPASQICLDGVDCLCTETSLNQEMWEILWWKAAHLKGIPSLAAIDFWSNYGARFCDNNGTHIFPLKIALPDAVALDEVIQEAIIPPERCIIIGSPLLDSLQTIPVLSQVHKQGIRRQCGVKEEEKLIVYVSQPLKALHVLMKDESPIDEEEVLKDFEKVLQSWSQPLEGRGVVLRIKLHPRECPIQAYPHAGRYGVQTEIEQKIDTYDLLRSADLVLGIHSMLLIEACCLGCVVLSYQPGVSKDILPSNRLGWSTGCYDFATMAEKLVDLLEEGGTIRTPVQLGSNPCESLIQELIRMQGEVYAASTLPI